MIPVAAFVGILKAGALVAEQVKNLISKEPEKSNGLDFSAIADAVGNLVTQGEQFFHEAKATLSTDDEGQIKSALALIRSENDALYQTVSAKLDAASKEG